MMKFTVEEVNFMCVFKDKSRLKLMGMIGRSLNYVEEDEMKVLVKQIMNKLQDMRDEEYSELIFEPAEDYKDPLF